MGMDAAAAAAAASATSVGSSSAGTNPGATRAGGLALVDQLLRDRRGVLARIEAGVGLAALMRVFVMSIVVCAAITGAAMGAFRGGVQIAYAAAKLPIALLVTAALCAPALTALSRAVGREATMAKDLALVVTALATGGLVMVALVPVMLVARAVDFQYHGSILLTVTCGGFGGLAAVAVMAAGLHRASSKDAGLVLALFATLFMMVGAQVAWTGRPWLVRPRTEDVPFLRPVEGSLYDAVLQSTRSARGVYGREAAPLSYEVVP
ncbi:MAG TPA: hypothetical protein VM261_35880 [Kofleriaceae bacterium]|nr:hypothetical protein [Kofleriaceae bacterium]